MSIDPNYQPLYNQAKDMQFKFQDLLGHTNPTATVLHNEVKQLVTDLELNKHPRDIENRIQTIQHQMNQVEHQGANLMTYEHAHGINHDFEQMRQTVRHFNNY